MCLDCFYSGPQKVSKSSKFVTFGLFVLHLLPLWSPGRGNQAKSKALPMQCGGYRDYLLYSGCYWQKYFCKNRNIGSLGCLGGGMGDGGGVCGCVFLITL